MDSDSKYTENELDDDSEEDSKIWRGIAVAILVIVAMCSVIAAVVFYLSPEFGRGSEEKERITLDDILLGSLSPSHFNATWISEHELIYMDQGGHLLLLDLTRPSLKPTTFVKNSVFQSQYIPKYSLSFDRTHILLVSEPEKVFRYTFNAKYVTLRIDDEKLTRLTVNGNEADARLQYASWGPKGTQLIFVHRQNIYYKSNASATPQLIIQSEDESVIFNGIPDWLYEEEILTKGNAIWWSLNGSRVAFASFNDTQVDTMAFARYGSYEDMSNVYPNVEFIRYPKPGRPNPAFTLWVAELELSEIYLKKLIPPIEIREIEHYFTTVTWIDEENISVIWLNRVQNLSLLTICSANDQWTCKVNFEVSAINNDGWVDFHDPPVFKAGGKHYFVRLPLYQPQVDDFYRHVAIVSRTSRKKKFLTSGHFEVTEILAYDHENELLYYQSTKENRIGERHLYALNKSSASTCLSCKIDDQCLYSSSTFSGQAKYFIFECLGPRLPYTRIYSAPDNRLLLTLEDNHQLGDKLQKKLLPKVITTIISVNGVNASVKLYLPSQLKEDEITKYPMVIYVYGGPGSQQVNERFTISWAHYLTIKRSIIYGMIDGRGSGFNGEKQLHSVYHKLGTFEVDDQMQITERMVSKFNFIDEKRIGIWGWSYGGYVTAMALSNKNTPFTCGIAVAPVTNWLYYDSAYTERYMGIPDADTYLNYQRADVLKRVNEFNAKRFLLIHGTADDNVHVQQSMMLMKALTNAGLLFEQQIYPDEDHSLLGVHTHLYKKMETFWVNCFDLLTHHDDVGLKQKAFKKFNF